MNATATNPRRRARTDQKRQQRAAMARRWREADVRAQKEAADRMLDVWLAWRRWQDESEAAAFFGVDMTVDDFTPIRLE